MGLNIGDVVSERYEIIQPISEGSLTDVFECFDQKIRRKRALRALLDSLCDNADAIGRFHKSVYAPGLCESEHVLDVFDVGQLPSGALFSIGELLHGTLLSARLQEQDRLAPHEIAPIAVNILDALADIHRTGIVLRGLSPDAIFLSQDRRGIPDFVKITDFDLALFPRGEVPSYQPERIGVVVGTPYYMSPEQAKGSTEIDGRSDLYAVGVILYEAVTGQVPFDADTFNELIFKIVLEPFPPPCELVPELDAQFAATITKAMSRHPEERYPSASEFRQALSAWLPNP